MVPICFNGSVYIMDATRQTMEKFNISKEDECRIQDEAVKTSDTSLLDEVVMVNPISVPATLADKEDIKASETYDASQNLAKNQSEVASPHLLLNVDSDFSSTKVFLSVLLDSGSSKENPTAKTSAVKEHILPKLFLTVSQIWMKKRLTK